MRVLALQSLVRRKSSRTAERISVPFDTGTHYQDFLITMGLKKNAHFIREFRCTNRTLFINSVVCFTGVHSLFYSEFSIECFLFQFTVFSLFRKATQ
jgi:hypothetical protein